MGYKIQNYYSNYPENHNFDNGFWVTGHTTYKTFKEAFEQWKKLHRVTGIYRIVRVH